MSKHIVTKKGPALWRKARKIIPGGGQLLSKRAEMFLPDHWPSYYRQAKGIEVVDLDGNRLIDMSYMGVGSCVLGYADPDVDRAAIGAIRRGSASTLNCSEEVTLAELLLDIHPWAQMARFARSGGEAATVGVRIARAFSGKDTIAFCGYHGWHDWYLASNLANDKNLDGHLLPGLEPRGVPRGLKGTMLPFEYNDIDQLKAIVKKHNIGVIIMEPFRHQEPKRGFLESVRRIASQAKAVLIFDEVSSAWRKNVGGVHLLYDVVPDMAIFAKAMGNGFPIAAVIGKRNVMQAAQSTFISSTNWTERTGPAAALATVEKMRRLQVPLHLQRIGTLIMEGWARLAQKHGLNIEVIGPPSVCLFALQYGTMNMALKTLFIQEMLMRGFLASNIIYVSYAHKEKHITKYLKAVDEVFGSMSKAIATKSVRAMLKGPIAHAEFKRLT